MKVQLYCDGGCHNTGQFKGTGAWAFVFVDESGNIIKSDSALGEDKTTNNRMEYIAFMEALKYLLKNEQITEVEAFSDSMLLINTYNDWLDKWVARNIVGNKANSDLLFEMVGIRNSVKREMKTRGLKVDFKWVKGHSGNIWNEHCDKACTQHINAKIAALKASVPVGSKVLKIEREKRPVDVCFDNYFNQLVSSIDHMKVSDKEKEMTRVIYKDLRTSFKKFYVNF